jgi:hypothetical protein
MKTTVKSIPFFLILFIFATASACKKKSSEEPGTQFSAKTVLLTKSNWYLSDNETKVGAGGTWGSNYQGIYDCKKDDYLKFKTDYTGVSDEGVTKCNTLDPQSAPFTWAFSDNETKITFQNSTATIDVLTETSMVVTYTDNYFTPARYNRLTFRH